MNHFRMIVLILVLLPFARAHAADSPVSGNVAIVSDYVFRGLSQSWGRPAIQGGADYANPNGVALGLWGSSISERSYPGGAMELDLYASYGRAIDNEWSWRVGLYGYLYPGANLDQAGLPSRSLNTAEANLALTWKQLTLKYNRALTDYFGVDKEQGYRGDSRGTGYLQLDLAIPLGDAWSLSLHAAHTHYTTALADGARDPGYNDFGATLKVELTDRWSLSGGFTYATNADVYRHATSFLDASDIRNVGDSRGFVMLQGAF